MDAKADSVPTLTSSVRSSARAQTLPSASSNNSALRGSSSSSSARKGSSSNKNALVVVVLVVDAVADSSKVRINTPTLRTLLTLRRLPSPRDRTQQWTCAPSCVS